MIYRKNLYGPYRVKKAIPYKENNKVIITIYFENNEIGITPNKKQRFSNSFVIDLQKIPREVTRIDFYYKQKGCKKIKIAEYFVKTIKE